MSTSTSTTAPKAVAPPAAGVVPAPTQALKPAAPPFTIHPLAGHTRWLKLLGYGDYGVGKTRLVGSAVLVEQMRDVLFIDCEAGDLTIVTETDKDYSEAAKDYMDVVLVKTFKELAKVQEFLKVHCRLRDEGDEDKLKELELKLMPDSDPDKPARKYRTAIIDSLSEADSFSMYQLLGITDKTRLDEEVASPEWAEYKRNYNQMLRLVRAYRDLPMHILMTAASTYAQDDTKKMIYQPALTGRLSKACQGFMDIVGYMHVVAGENNMKTHVIQVQPSGRINAKCRFSNFKELGWSNPTMLSILKSVGLLEKAKEKTGKEKEKA
jgi:hypothetical protein